jgi:hypothetical protein
MPRGVEIAQRSGLSVPAGIIAMATPRSRGRRAAAQDNLKLGERDPRSGEYIVESGLAVGDSILRYPSSALHDQQPVTQSGK